MKYSRHCINQCDVADMFSPCQSVCQRLRWDLLGTNPEEGQPSNDGHAQEDSSAYA